MSAQPVIDAYLKDSGPLGQQLLEAATSLAQQ